MVGCLDKVDLREVWEHEATNFTAWLSNNLDVLSDHIDWSSGTLFPRLNKIDIPQMFLELST